MIKKLMNDPFIMQLAAQDFMLAVLLVCYMRDGGVSEEWALCGWYGWAHLGDVWISDAMAWSEYLIYIF